MQGNGNRSLGAYGEKLAADYLRKKGFKIVTINYRTPVGEIDIIATKAKAYHFVEVKTRVGIVKGMPYEAVNYIKRNHMLRATQIYILQNSLSSHRLSLDVISIVLDQDKKHIDKLQFFENITS